MTGRASWLRLATLAGCLALAVTALGSGACSSLPASFDLGETYGRSAREHGPDQNPIIVIPGLTGSRLVDGESGRVVWGAFAGTYARPNRPEDARLIALPMARGAGLDELRDSVHPDGVLESVKVRVLGLPLSLQAYFHILAALGAGGYRDESLHLAGVVDWGEDHFTCFQFDYDWRRDNVENARRLARFIDEKRELLRGEIRQRWGVDRDDIRFDVVSHSMGGLLLRYYLRYGDAELGDEGELPVLDWAGAERIERAVLVAPPNAGTIEAVVQLVEGRDYGPTIAAYPAALLGTFPSGYQMLPRPRHGAVVWAAGGGPVGDLFDPELWQRLEWGLASPAAAELLAWLLPEEGDPAVRREIALDHLAKSLGRARRFAEALDRPARLPPGLELFLVAGDGVATASSLAVDRASGAIAVAATAPGDGKVLRSSALLDERLDGEWTPHLRSPIDWTDVLLLFEGHLGLTRDPTFTNNLLFWLLEDPRERAAAPSAAARREVGEWHNRRPSTGVTTAHRDRQEEVAR